MFIFMLTQEYAEAVTLFSRAVDASASPSSATFSNFSAAPLAHATYSQYSGGHVHCGQYSTSMCTPRARSNAVSVARRGDGRRCAV